MRRVLGQGSAAAGVVDLLGIRTARCRPADHGVEPLAGNCSATGATARCLLPCATARSSRPRPSNGPRPAITRSVSNAHPSEEPAHHSRPVTSRHPRRRHKILSLVVSRMGGSAECIRISTEAVCQANSECPAMSWARCWEYRAVRSASCSEHDRGGDVGRDDEACCREYERPASGGLAWQVAQRQQELAHERVRSDRSGEHDPGMRCDR